MLHSALAVKSKAELCKSLNEMMGHSAVCMALL